MQRLVQQNSWGILVLLVLPVALCGISTATAEPDYSITYTITLVPDGSALWASMFGTSPFLRIGAAIPAENIGIITGGSGPCFCRVPDQPFRMDGSGKTFFLLGMEQ